MPPADGCSQTSKPSQASPQSVSADSQRGEVEGSSDNNSPPTSVIQNDGDQESKAAFDWMRGAFQSQIQQGSKEFLTHCQELNSDKFSPKYQNSIVANRLNHESGFRYNL